MAPNLKKVDELKKLISHKAEIVYEGKMKVKQISRGTNKQKTKQKIKIRKTLL